MFLHYATEIDFSLTFIIIQNVPFVLRQKDINEPQCVTPAFVYIFITFAPFSAHQKGSNNYFYILIATIYSFLQTTSLSIPSELQNCLLV